MTAPTADGLEPHERRMLQAARLASIRRAFPTNNEIAVLLGLDPTAVAAWGREEGLACGEHERLVALVLVVEMLTGDLEPSSIRKWLLGVNGHLGDRRPVDLLRAGRVAAVLAAVEALESGAYV